MNEIEKHISIIERMMFAFATSTVDKKPIFPTLKYCKEALQEKLERENPQPLGLEELIKMDGEPVWMMYFDGSGARWGIVKITICGVCAIADCDTSYWFGGVHGPLAYRHKPDLVNVNKIEHIGEATNMVEGE